MAVIASQVLLIPAGDHHVVFAYSGDHFKLAPTSRRCQCAAEPCTDARVDDLLQQVTA
jgi:hypothetical protein